MRSYPGVWLSLLLLTAACAEDAGSGGAAAPGVAGSAAPAESGAALFFEHGGVELGTSRAELHERLGAPDSAAARTVANRHDQTVTDSVLTLYYPGLVVEVYRAGYDGKEIVSQVTISDERYVAAGSPVRLGHTAAAVQHALGPPDELLGDTLQYLCEECLVAGHETVRFVLAAGVVRRIEIRHWID